MLFDYTDTYTLIIRLRRVIVPQLRVFPKSFNWVWGCVVCVCSGGGGGEKGERSSCEASLKASLRDRVYLLALTLATRS